MKTRALVSVICRKLHTENCKCVYVDFVTDGARRGLPMSLIADSYFAVDQFFLTPEKARQLRIVRGDIRVM